MALYFYFNETTGDLVYSDQATYSGSGYTSLGQQSDTSPRIASDWVFDSQRASIKTVNRDPIMSAPISALTSMGCMFRDCGLLTSLDLSGFDTSSVTDMSEMFRSCSALTSLDLSDFDTSSVIYMSQVFCFCTALTSLDLSNFNTWNVRNMNSMFEGCSALTSLDLNSFDTFLVGMMSRMFYGCTALTSLDLSNFNTWNVTNMNSMFADNESLRIIDISPNMSNALDQLPAATYYDAVTRQSYNKADIPGGSTYVRDLADLDLVATMVQTRMGINKIKGMLNEVRDLSQRLRDDLGFVSEDKVSSMYINTESSSEPVAVGDYSSISYAPAKGVFSHVPAKSVFRYSVELLKLTGAIPWSYNETIEGAISLDFNISAVLGGKQIDADVPGSSNISFPVLLIKGNALNALPDNAYPGVCVCTPIASNGEIGCRMFFNVPTIRSGESMILYF